MFIFKFIKRTIGEILWNSALTPGGFSLPKFCNNKEFRSFIYSLYLFHLMDVRYVF